MRKRAAGAPRRAPNPEDPTNYTISPWWSNPRSAGRLATQNALDEDINATLASINKVLKLSQLKPIDTYTDRPQDEPETTYPKAA